METFTLYVNDRPNLHFKGKLLASESTKITADGYAREQWEEADLYLTQGGKYVCYRAERSTSRTGKETFTAAVCEKECEVVDFFGYSDVAKSIYELADFYIGLTCENIY